MAAQSLDLQNARTLTVTPSEEGDLVEIHASGGQVELRIRLTPDGPVLQMESIRLSLKSAENVDVNCKNFEVRATEGVDLHSDGGMQLSGQADVKIDSAGNVIVKGEMIYLN
jgi:phage gp45-like